jgi:hypothetical protein
MTDESATLGGPAGSATSTPSLPVAAGRAIFQTELGQVRGPGPAPGRDQRLIT